VLGAMVFGKSWTRAFQYGVRMYLETTDLGRVDGSRHEIRSAHAWRDE
jgi:hypothetical protein